MKRIISLLLLVCMLAGVFASCESVSEVSDVSDVSETDPEESKIEREPTDENTKHTLISVGKTYKLTNPPDDTYPDLFNQQLTDGQKSKDSGVSYTDVRMVGFTDDTRVNIDLGEDGKRISGMSVRSLDIDLDGVKLAGMAKFYGSDTGKTGDWTLLGSTSFQPTGDQSVSVARVEFSELYDFRYVRATVTMGKGLFFFIDEVEVYADVDEEEKTDVAVLEYENDNTDYDSWKALSDGETVAPLYYQNVAQFSDYKFNNCVFDTRAPQNDEYLIDSSRTGRVFGEDVWVGISAEQASSITVDLGKKQSKLFSFRAYMLGSGLDVAFPGYIEVYGSENGKDFAFLGRIYAPAGGDTHPFALIMQEYITARYIRFDFPAGEGNYWIEEIEVYQAVDEAVGEFYPPVYYPDVTEEVYWSSGDKDYNKKQNLLLGVVQQVACEGYVDPNEERLTPSNSAILTDGKQASDMYCYSSGWFFAKSGQAVEYFFDIGKLSAIESMSISLLEQTAWGIARPKFMSVFLSEDGENWYKVGDYARGDASLNADATRLSFDFEFTPYVARFVRFRIEAAGNMFIDEMQAFGTKSVSGAARLSESGITPVKYYTNSEESEYATKENTGLKAEEIRCAYGNGGEGTLLPYVAYLDEEGNIVDTFIDGFIYGVVGGFPSGGLAHTYSYKGDWEYIFDTVFNGVTGLDELEKTVGEVKKALDKPDYKVYVYITITGIHESVTDFGDVNGDGISEDLSTEEGRNAVLNWYTDMCIAEFEKRGYENIALDGFYWHLESVTWEVDDSHIIKQAADVVHSKDTNLLWVPYYTANRYHQGYELGFDMVCMQPNFMFDLKQPLYRFDVTATRTKRMNMCVEIEHSYQALSDPQFVRNYMLYLYYGAVYGYMDAIHVYYDDVTNYARLAYSDDPMLRMQYDATYHFACGDLDITPEKRDTVSVSAEKDTVCDGALGTDGELALYTLVSSTAHGSITLSSNGSFRYLPQKGFTGTDSFTYTYNNYLGESEECTVEIVVE